ncbi:porin family protein [Xanthomarina sp. F1114]|uniref:porin family protein n=1 Tax=Xanthomarina sp. F1114 TaxID=2996019 RepID=UPI00225E28BE|nr:porin family protein [Xanthomarina sp. F1114]MCX7547067.1 porin family protein [Xanthomarina sp. F1114]
MKFVLFFLIGWLCITTVYAQENVVIDSSVVDTKYREDQFYLAITYNLLTKKPNNVKQTGFSSGFHFGFIRDFPLNKRRNFGLALGLGASINSYNHNIYMSETESGDIDFINLSDADINYSKNKFNTYLLEMPFELRWRTSTATEYKFWRVYTGFKVGYLIANATKFKGDLGKIRHTNLDAFNNFQYGLTLSAGYNTWNFHVYYSLNSILNSDARLGPKPIDMSSVKFGLIFYVL